MKMIFTALLLSALPAFAAPTVELKLSGPGLILQSSGQSCVDLATASVPPMVSLYPSIVRWASATLTWDSSDRDFYIGQMKITLTSPDFAGGKYVATLDSNEIDFLFGLANSTVPHSTQAGVPVVLTSTSVTKGATSSGLRAVPCGLAVGGVAIDTVATPFTANAEISLIGFAIDPQGKLADEVIRLSTTSTATLY